MAKNNKKKIIAPIASVATSAIVATTAGLVAVNKEELASSRLDVNVPSIPSNQNEYANNKKREAVNLRSVGQTNPIDVSNALYVPFNHEIMNGYAKVATATANATTFTRSDDQKLEAIKQALKHTFDKETYGSRFHAENGGEVEFGSVRINRNTMNEVVVTASSTQPVTTGNEVYDIRLGTNEYTIEVPSFEMKTVDASSYPKQLKMVISSYISSIDDNTSVTKPRFDIEGLVMDEESRPPRWNGKFVHGRIYYDNKVFENISNNSEARHWSTSGDFNRKNLKYWYSMRENTLFAYNADQKRVFAFKNWGAFINVNELLSLEEIFLNQRIDDPTKNITERNNVFSNPAERDIKIKEALDRKYLNTGSEVTKIGKEEIPVLRSISEKRKIEGVVSNSRYLRYLWLKNDDELNTNQNRPLDISYDNWEVVTDGYDGEASFTIELVETEPYVHTTIGYDYYDQQRHSRSNEYINGILEIYDVFNGRKKITLKELNDRYPNNYLINRFFKYGDSINKGYETGYGYGMDANASNTFRPNDNSDLRSTNMLFTLGKRAKVGDTWKETNDAREGNIDLSLITIELITLGDRTALLVENGLSLNGLNYDPSFRRNSWKRTAGRKIKYLIDDMPILFDDSKFGALEEEDYLRWANSKSDIVKNQSSTTTWNSYDDNTFIRGLFNDRDFRAIKERFARNQVGWTIFQKLTNEYGDAKTQKFDFNGTKIDFNRLVPFVGTQDTNNFNESLVTTYGIAEFGVQYDVPSSVNTNNNTKFDQTKRIYRLHGLVKNRNEVTSPYFKPDIKPANHWDADRFTKSFQDWAWLKPNSIGVDGILTTNYFISNLKKLPEINYNDPYDGNPHKTESNFSAPSNGGTFVISKKQNEPEKRKLVSFSDGTTSDNEFNLNNLPSTSNPKRRFDLRDGFINLYWPQEVNDWVTNKNEVKIPLGKYFTEYMFKNSSDTNSSGVNTATDDNRYTIDNNSGILTGLETIQYYPEYSAALVSDNGYYRVWDTASNSFITKRRFVNGSLVPAIRIVYGIQPTEISSRVFEIYDLAKNNWDKRKTIEYVLSNKKTNASGEKIVSTNFNLLNPKLSNNKYGNDDDNTVTNNVNIENGLDRNSPHKYRDDDRFQIEFENKFGETKNLLLFDVNVIHNVKGNGEEIFTNVESFNNFFKLELSDNLDDINEGVNKQAIILFLESVKNSNEKLNTSSGQKVNLDISKLKVAKVGDKIVITVPTGRKLPVDIPDNYKNLTNVYELEQELWVIIENLPLYYKDSDINVPTPTVKKLIDTGLTFEEYLKKEFNAHLRSGSNANKVTFGPSTNPDIEVDDAQSLTISFDYDKQIINVTGPSREIDPNTQQPKLKTIKIKATRGIPQVKYINATQLVAQDRDYVNGLKFINEDVYSKVIKLDAANSIDAVSGENSSTALNPNKANPSGYINVPTADDSSNNVARELYHSYEEIKNQFPENMRKTSDLADAQVRFDANNNRLILIDNGESGSNATNKPAALVIRLMPNTLWSADLVDNANNSVHTHAGSKNKFVNKVLENNGDVKLTITNLLAQFSAVDNKKYIGGYSLLNDDELKVLDDKQNSLIQIQGNVEANKKINIGLYDEYSYFLESVDGAELFSDFNKLAETIQNSRYPENDNNPRNITTDLPYALNNNAELVQINASNSVNNFVRGVVGETINVNEHQTGQPTIKYVVVEKEGKKFGRFIVKGWIEEGNQKNKPALYNIDNVPNVVKSNIKPTLDEIINQNGDEFTALVEKWKTIIDKAQNPNLYFENGKIHIGIAEFDPQEVKLSIDESRKYVSVRNKADNKLIAVVILENQLERVIAKEKLFTWNEVVDTNMNLSTLIANKVAINSGSFVKDNDNDVGYLLDGYRLATNQNVEKAYVLENADQKIYVIDDYKYNERTTKTPKAEIDSLFNGEEIFTEQVKFIALYNSLTEQEVALSTLEASNVELLKNWLNSNNSINEFFKNTHVDSVKIRKYKDKLVLISENNTHNVKQLLAIGNLPGIVLDSDIGLFIPTLDQLIENNKTFEEELLERLIKLNKVNENEFRLANNTFNKNNVTFSYDYANNRITLTQGNDKANIIQSSRELSNVKFVESNNTKKTQSAATSINFDDLNNAYFVNNLYKEILRLPDFSSEKPGEKLISSLQPNIIKNDNFDLKVQSGELTAELLNGTEFLFDKDSTNMSIRYDVARDRLIIKDNDKTPTALVITNLKRYTDTSLVTLTPNIATNSVNNLEVKKFIDNSINPNSDATEVKNISSYEIYNPVYEYAASGTLYATIKYQKTPGEGVPRDGTIYVINSNKFHDKVEYTNTDPAIDPLKFYNIKKYGSQTFVDVDSYKEADEKELIKQLFEKASGESYDNFTNVKYKFIVRDREHNEIMFSANKVDTSNFPSNRTYYFKLTNLINVVDDSSRNLKTPTVADIIASGFNNNKAFKEKWVMNSSNEYVVGTKKIDQASLNVELSDNRKYITVKENSNVVGYVIFKNPIETVEELDYSEVPADQLKSIIEISRNLFNQTEIAQSQERLVELEFKLREKLANFERSTISVEIRPDGSLLIYDKKAESPNYLMLTNVPVLLNSSSFYTIRDVILASDASFDPKPLIKAKWDADKQIGGKTVVNPVVNSTKTIANFYGYNEEASPNKYIYVNDPINYIENIADANDRIRDNQAYKTSVLRARINEVSQAEFNNPEIDAIITAANWNLTDIKLRVYGTKILVTGQRDGKTYKALIKNLPKILDDSGLDFPSEEEIIYTHLGNVTNALNAMIADTSKTPRVETDKIAIYTTRYTADQVNLEFVNTDGSIKFTYNNQLQTPISPSIPFGSYKVVDADQNRTKMSPQNALAIIGAIKKLQPNESNQVLLGDLKDNEYISSHLPSDLDLNNATIEYVLEKNMIIIRGSNNNGNRLIFTNVPKVVDPYEVNLYTIEDVARKLQDVHATIVEKYNAINEVNSKKSVGDYSIDSPSTVADKELRSEGVYNITSSAPETETNKFSRRNIVIYDANEFAPWIDAINRNTFNVKNDLKLVLDNVETTFKTINQENKLLNNSIQTLLDINGIQLANAQIKSIQVPDKGVGLLIKGQTDANKTKLLLVTNLPTIIPTKFEDLSNVIPVINANDLLQAEGNTLKARMESAYKNVISNIAKLNNNSININGINVEIGEISVRANDANDPVEFEISNTKDDVTKVIGTIILSEQELPKFDVVVQPNQWSNNPELASDFYTRLKNVGDNNFTSIIADENLRAVLPNNFNTNDESLSVVFDVNDKGLYAITNKHLVIISNPVLAVDHSEVYSIDEVVSNQNDVNGLLDKKIKTISGLVEANRKVGDIKVPSDIQVDRKDKGFNTLLPTNTSMRRIYIIDKHNYKRPVSAEVVFKNNVNLKTLLDTLSNDANEYVPLSTLNNQELNNYMTSQRVQASEANAKLITKTDGSKILLVKSNNTKESIVFAIDQIPTIYREDEIDVTFPTKEEIITANGDVNQAIITKFTKNSKITIKGEEFEPNSVVSKINLDGSITLLLSNGQKVIVTSQNPLPVVYSENANTNDYAKVYELTKVIVGAQKNQPITSSIYSNVQNVEYASSLITRALGSELPANLANATVSYRKESSQVIIDVPKTNDNFGFLVILNKVPQVIEARDVYSVNEAIENISNLNEFIKTKLLEKANQNANKVDGFVVNDEMVVTKQNTTNFYASSPESVAQKLNNIYIVDNYQYVTNKIDGSRVFKDIISFFELSKQVKNASSGFSANNPLAGGINKSALNNDNFNKFSESNSLFNADPKLIHPTNKDYWILNQDNAIAIIENLPKVSDESSAFGDKHLPTPQEVIALGGNYIEAVRSNLKTPDNKLIVNGKEFDATNTTITVNDDNTISFTNPETNETETVVVTNKIPKYITYNAKIHTAFKDLNEVHKLREFLNKKTQNTSANQFLANSMLTEMLESEKNPLNNPDIYPVNIRENGQFQFDKANNRLVLFNNVFESPRYIVVNNYHQTMSASDIYTNEQVVNKNMQVIELLKQKYANTTTIGSYNNIAQPLTITKSGNDYVITGNKQKQVYVIDGKIYDTQPIDGSVVFDSLKTLYRFEKALGKDKANIKTLGSLADVDGLIKTQLLEETISNVKNLDYNSTKIQYLAEGLFVIEGYDRVAKTNKVIAIRGIPKVVKYNDPSLPNITEPTAAEVTAANGSVAQAIKKKLEAAATTGQDGQKTLTINGQTYPLSDIDVRRLEDGTVQIFQVAKPGQKEVPLVSIVQDNDNNQYEVKDASNDQFFAKPNDSKTNTNNLISSIDNVPTKDPSKPEEKLLAAVIAQYNELKKKSIDPNNVNNDENSIEKLLERSGFDVNANPDATIKYDPVSNQFIVSDNKDPANIVIINGVAKSINSDVLYSPRDVLLNNIDVIKTIRAKLNEKAQDQTSVKIGNYDTIPEFTLSKNRAQENVITDSTQPSYNEITIIAQDKFAQDIIDGSKIFTEIKPFKKLSDLLKAEQTVPLNDQRITNNQELVNELTKLNIPRENAQLVYINDFLWMIKLPRNQLSAEPNIYGIALIPFVVDQEQADFKFPSIEEVIATNGNIEEAFKQKIAALKPDKNGNVIINGQSINPNYTQVEVDPDGSVKIYTYNPVKPNERKLVVGINQENDSFKTPVYLQRDGSSLDYLTTKALYDKFAEKPLTANKQTELKTKLINLLPNEFLIDQLREDPTNKSSNQIDINVSAAVVTYDSELGNISIESTKNGDDTKVVVVIKNMKNVIRANELYDIGKVKENNPVDIILKALADPKNKSTTKKGVLVGNLRYEVISPFVEELDQKHDNDRMIVDSNNKIIYIIDNSEYSIFTPQQAQEALADKDQTNNLVAKLNKNNGEFTKANDLNDPQINALLQQQGLDPSKTSVAYIDGNIQLTTVQPDGSIKVASLPGVANAISSDYVKLPSDTIIIEDNAAKIQAIKKALENPEINPQNEEGKIRLGSALVDPSQLLIDINPDNSISLSRQNPSNVSEKILVATWLPNQEDKKVVQTNYKGYNSKDLENDSISKLLVDLTKLMENNNETQSLSGFLNNNVIKTIAKEDFGLANATISFNNETKSKIVIRNNDNNNPKVIVIYNLPELSEAQNSQVDEKVAVREDDKVRIWAPIVAAVAALFALVTGLSVGIKKAKSKRRGK